MILLLKNMIFLVLVPGTVAGVLPWAISREHLANPGWAAIGAVFLFVLGGGIITWCVLDFALYGRGTPAPIDAPKKLVIRGLYKWVRNPMYLGVLIILSAWIVWFQTAGLVVYAVIVAACFHMFVLFYEEPHLQNRFGDEYAEYKTRVGRWLPKPRYKAQSS